jgi:hypothetical protein
MSRSHKASTSEPGVFLSPRAREGQCLPADPARSALARSLRTSDFVKTGPESSRIELAGQLTMTRGLVFTMSLESLLDLRQMQGRGMPMPDRLFPRRGRVDRLQRDRHLDELFTYMHSVNSTILRIASSVFSRCSLTSKVVQLTDPSPGRPERSRGRQGCLRSPSPFQRTSRDALKGPLS